MKRAILLLVPVLALAGDFVTNQNATLPAPKRDARPLPPGADPTLYLRATDFNALRDATLDLRGWVYSPTFTTSLTVPSLTVTGNLTANVTGNASSSSVTAAASSRTLSQWMEYLAGLVESVSARVTALEGAGSVFPQTVVGPTFSPAPGTFAAAQTVTLSTATSGASIYYTTDGTTPDATKTLYSAPFSVSATATVKAIGIKSGLTNSAITSATYVIDQPPSGTSSRTGINLSFVTDWNTERFYADAVRNARTVNNTSGQNINLTSDTDADGWPKVDFDLGLVFGLNDLHGTYRLEMTGQANTIGCASITCTVTDKAYDAPTNRTTATITIPASQAAISSFSMTFRGTKRLPADALGTGATNIRLWRPEAPDSTTSFPGTSPFSLKLTGGAWSPFGTMLRKFEVIRFMDATFTNHNQERLWSERVSPTQISQNAEYQRSPLRGAKRGISWEDVIAFSNEVYADAATVERGIWINIPVLATDDYVVRLAQLIKCGSDGVNPWVSAGTNTCAAGTPAFAALNPAIKVYVEFANELWLWSFGQTHDNMDAMGAEIVAANGAIPENWDDDAHRAATSTAPAYSPTTTYSANTIVTNNGWEWICKAPSPITGVEAGPGPYWDIVAEHSLYPRRAARKSVAISNMFRAVFGDSSMMSRIRPVLATQAVNGNTFHQQAILLQNYYNNGDGDHWPSGDGPTLAANTGSAYTAPADGQAHPPSYYFYSIGGAPYIDPTENGGNLTDTTNALTTGNMVVATWQNQYLLPGMRYAPMLGLKHATYEGGPGPWVESQVWYDATQIKRPASPNMTEKVLDHQRGFDAMGGDLFVYYALGGSKRWNFLPFTGTGGTPNVFSTDSAKLAGIDEINAGSKEALGSYGTLIPGTATAFEWGYTTGWYTLTTTLGAARGQTNWIAYLFRAADASASSTITLTKTGTGTAKVYFDGAPLTTTDGGTTWTGPALTPGLHGVIVRAVTGTFTANSVAIATTAPPPPPEGIADSFDAVDGSSLGANWEKPSWAYGATVVSGNAAVPGGTAGEGYAARWVGATTVGADQTVIARLGPGVASGSGTSLVARYYDASNWVEASRRASGTGWMFKVRIAGATVGLSNQSNPDPWVKVVCAATVCTFYTGQTGTTWTQRHQITDAGLTFGGQPGFFFWTGFDTTGTASTHFVDDFSAQ